MCAHPQRASSFRCDFIAFMVFNSSFLRLLIYNGGNLMACGERELQRGMSSPDLLREEENAKHRVDRRTTTPPHLRATLS
jgi:hypothetical protein